jgi:hypothetical protein
MTLTIILVVSVIFAGIIIYSMQDDDFTNWDE